MIEINDYEFGLKKLRDRNGRKCWLLNVTSPETSFRLYKPFYTRKALVLGILKLYSKNFVKAMLNRRVYAMCRNAGSEIRCFTTSCSVCIYWEKK